MATKKKMLAALTAAAGIKKSAGPRSLIQLENQSFQLLVELANQAPLDEEEESPTSKEGRDKRSVAEILREQLGEDASDVKVEDEEDDEA
jgi:hypothetical protein